MEVTTMTPSGANSFSGGYNDVVGGYAAYNSCELRREVAKIESDLRETIANQTISNNNQFCDLSKSIMENRAQLTLAITKAEYEGKLATQAAIKEINSTVTHGFEEVAEDVSNGFSKLAECCCELKQLVANGFSHSREEDLENEVAELRQEQLLAKIK